MQKEKLHVRLIEQRVCPTCNASFEPHKNFTHCPDDLTLLCPVTAGHTGMSVGDWTVLELIGEGSSARVYRAVNEATNIVSAIKFLKLSFQSNPQAVKRFQQEALAIKQLTNGSITALYDFGILEDGTPYLIMEFVQGQTLQQLLETRGTLSEETIRSLFLQIAEAMEVAHAKRILHLDLKPGNLIVDEKMNVKIVDFGLAKFCDVECVASITRTGMSLGTPAYMSPEQCTGEELDWRSDIYSLGCVMYECMTNRPIFETEKAVGFYHKHAFEAPLAPSKHLGKAPQLSSPSFKQLEQIVMACLRKDRSDRIQSMQELQSVLRGKPVRTSRKRTLPGLSMALVSAIALVVVISLAAVFFLQQSLPSTGVDSFVPPHAVVAKSAQKAFNVPKGQYLCINMEDKKGAGYKNGSLTYVRDDGVAPLTATSKECFNAWQDYYFNLFSYMKSMGASPADVRMKINVSITADGKVSANPEWQDQLSAPQSIAYVNKFMAALNKLDKSPLTVFPSSAQESINFEIFLGPDGSLQLNNFEQALR